MGKVGRAEALTAERASAGAVARPASAPPAMCSLCNQRMAREKMRGVEVDRCAAHGFWFDRDEILHVLANKPSLGRAAMIGGAAMAGAAVAGAAIAGAGMGPSDSRTRGVVDAVADRSEVLLDTVDAVDVVGSAVDVAPSVLEGAGEVAGSLVEIVAGLFDGL